MVNWMMDWDRRQKITLTGGSDGAQTDYPLKLTIPYDSDMESDFDDLRFTESDGLTLLDAWLESKTDGVSAVVWVKFPTTPANTITEDYYMYYGNSLVNDIWDGDDTFILFDDFAGTTLDVTNKWIINSGTPTVNDGLSLNDSERITTKNDCLNTTRIRYKATIYDELTPTHYTGLYNSTNYYSCFFLTGSGNWDTRTRDGAGNSITTIGSYAGEHIFEIRKNSNIEVKYYVDTLKNTDIFNIPSTNLPIVFSKNGSNSLLVSWVFNTKYTPNSATYGLGSEEKIADGWTIYINNIKYEDFENIKVLDTIAGSKKFDAIFSSSDKDTTFNHYDDIKIYGESDRLIFRGRIEEIIPNHNNDITTISGRDYLGELIDKYVVEAYSNKLRSYIIDDIVNKNSTHLTRSNIQASPVGTELTYTYKSSVFDILIQCASEDEYRFWSDTNNDLHYVPKGYTDSGLTLILGTDDIYSYNIEETSTDVINRVTIYGGGSPQIIVMFEDMDSQTHYGIIKEKRILDNQVDTVALAESQAEAFLSENAWVIEMIEFEVDGYEDLNAGELITVTLSNNNIDDTYLVIDKTHKFPENVTIIRVARYAKNLENVINSLVERLLKIEQTFMDESAIMARIAKIYEQQGYTDELKIYKRDINTSFRLGVTGHCELGNITLKDNTGIWVEQHDSRWFTPISATALSEYSTNVAGNAIDDNTASYWASVISETPTWIYFDLGSIKTFNKIKIWISVGLVPETLNVDTSDDTISWDNKVTGEVISTSEAWVEISFTSTTARYIRLYITSHQGHGIINEFKVYLE